MKITDCRVNHLQNPLGFELTRPVFSWKVTEAAGTKQRAARICVFREEEETPVYDSGWDENLSSLATAAEGLTLAPCTRYRWQVQVRTDAGAGEANGAGADGASACEEGVSDWNYFETAKMDQPWTGKWIGCPDAERHPVYSRTVAAHPNARRARLYICGLGLYTAYWNATAGSGEKNSAPAGGAAGECLSGETGSAASVRIGDEYLTPGCTAYDSWIQYQTYDVTEQVRAGGQLRVELGNGWYKGRFGFVDHGDNRGFYGDEWKLIAELHILNEDRTGDGTENRTEGGTENRTGDGTENRTEGGTGNRTENRTGDGTENRAKGLTEEVIGTGEDWTLTRGNITFSNIYDGEHRDDTLPEVPGEAAALCEAPAGALTARYSIPVRAQETFRAAEVLHTPAGECVLDMGQNFAGLFRLRVHEKAGTLIRLQFGEVLQNGNFYRDNLRSAKAEYRYISDGTERVIEPRFTFYGYRYVKIEGVTDLKAEDFTGVALYSDMAQRGHLETGHAKVNRLIRNAEWGQKGNFIDVPTDCPQRDERMGWTGDAEVFAPTALLMREGYAFYRKYLHDCALEQRRTGGRVPDVIPSFGVDTCACAWGDAATIIPWELYRVYGDVRILEEQYESMKAWVDFIRETDGDDHGWRRHFHYGDWLALDGCGGVDGVLGGTDEGFIADVYYAQSAGIVAQAAQLLGYADDAEAYAALGARIRDGLAEEFYSPAGRCGQDTQTGHLLTLTHALGPHPERSEELLVERLQENGGKLRTGFIGTPLLCETLTAIGQTKMAYDLLLNEEYPGWLYCVNLGATTIWERWNSMLPDGSVSSTGMNSFNHYSYGAIVRWICERAAGLRQAEGSTGWRRAALEPHPEWRLKSARTEYDSPSGRWVCGWQIADENHVEMEIVVPFGCAAELALENYGGELRVTEGAEGMRTAAQTGGNNTNTGIESSDSSAAPEKTDLNGSGTAGRAAGTEAIAADSDNTYRATLQPGRYMLTYRTAHSLHRILSSAVPVRELLADQAARDCLRKHVPEALTLAPQEWHRPLRELAQIYNPALAAKMNEIDAWLQEL